eukprot:6492452-Amphidinium_carterae.1
MPMRTALLTSVAAVAYWAFSSTLLSALPSDLAAAVEHWLAPNLSSVWDSLMVACFSEEKNASTVVNECYYGYFGYGGYYYTELYTAGYVPYASCPASSSASSLSSWQSNYYCGGSCSYYYEGYTYARYSCSSTHSRPQLDFSEEHGSSSKDQPTALSWRKHMSELSLSTLTVAGALVVLALLILISVLRLCGGLPPFLGCAGRRALEWCRLPRDFVYDVGAILNIIGIACIDTALVLVKWAGPIKRPFRKQVLRARRRFAAAGSADDESDVLIGEPDDNRQTVQYVPLHLMQARYGGRRRWKGIARKPHRVVFNPEGKGHCLFLAFRYLARAQGLRNLTVPYLRKIVKDELTKIYNEDLRVEGKSLAAWARLLHRQPEELIASTTKGRWGNTLDLLLLSQLCCVPVTTFDLYTGDVLLDTSEGASLRFAMAWQNHHFVIVRRRVARMKTRSPVKASFVCVSGGVRRDVSAHPIVLRSYRVVGEPEEGTSTHNWSNGHDLAEMTARHFREQVQLAQQQLVSAGNTPEIFPRVGTDADDDEVDKAGWIVKLRQLRRAILGLYHPQLPTRERIQLGQDSDSSLGAIHVIENAQDLDEMEEVFQSVQEPVQAPQLLADEELDLPLPWLFIRRLRRTFHKASHYDGLEVMRPTPIAACPSPAKPVGIAQQRQRDPLDLAQLPGGSSRPAVESAFPQLDWSAEIPPGNVCNLHKLTAMMRQHLWEVEPREAHPVLLKNEELDFPLADIMVKRLRQALLQSRSRLRWWQQVNSTPVADEDPQCVRCRPIELVAGGGKQAQGTKRPYPYSGYTAEMFEQQDERSKRKLAEARRATPVVIVAHGSFNPVHFGHVHMMIRAKERLEEDGLRVVAGVMALAHRDWVQAKKAQVLSDYARACLIDLMCKEFHQDTWLHADERGVDFKSYWQMRPLLAKDYPGCTFYGVWGSDSTGTSFPSGPSVCVVRRGFEGPLQSVEDMHYVVHEQHTHQFSSTRVRKAITAGDISLVSSMMCPTLAWLAIGLFSPDPVERRTAHEALKLLDHTSSEDEDTGTAGRPAGNSSSQGAQSSRADDRAPLEKKRKLVQSAASTANADLPFEDPAVSVVQDVVQASVVFPSEDPAVSVGLVAGQVNAVSKAETEVMPVIQVNAVAAPSVHSLPAEVEGVRENAPEHSTQTILQRGKSMAKAAWTPPPAAQGTAAAKSKAEVAAMPPPPVPVRKHQNTRLVKLMTPPVVVATPKVVHNPPPRVPVRIVPKQRDGPSNEQPVESSVQQKSMPKPRVLLKERPQQPLQEANASGAEQHRQEPSQSSAPVEPTAVPQEVLPQDDVENELNQEGRVIKFEIEKLGGREPTFDLVVEPTLSMLGRNYKHMVLDEKNMLRVELGQLESSSVLCFPSRQQFRHLTRPLDVVAAKAGCLMLEGFMTSWLFAMLEIEDARRQLRNLIRSAIQAIKGQMVLSQLKVSIFGAENGFKLLRLYVMPTSGASLERMAWEIAYLFNLYIDNCHRENGLRLLRCYILQAGDMQDDCGFHREDTHIEYAFQAPVEGGGVANAISSLTHAHVQVLLVEYEIALCADFAFAIAVFLVCTGYQLTEFKRKYRPLCLRQGGARHARSAVLSTSHVVAF